jgi:hypothetical protein
MPDNYCTASTFILKTGFHSLLKGFYYAPDDLIRASLFYIVILCCTYINNKRSYPSLHVRAINCEIRVVIYTFFRLLGNEEFRKEVCGAERP